VNYQYIGNELEIFKEATNWKKYLASKITHYIGGTVLEVGAGIGSTTPFLYNNTVSSWTCLEPDSTLYQRLANKINMKEIQGTFVARNETISSLHVNETFDTVIYIDVLEHIEKDQHEFEEASKHLNKQGHLIILSPAFPFLFSPFDKAIGHYRRYNKNDLRKFSSHYMELDQVKYLDTIGFLASLMNKIFLRQSYPTQKQINFWDKKLVPISKISDRFFFYSFGKSILGIWRKK
jgi:SAM-dependent methyltransferase